MGAPPFPSFIEHLTTISTFPSLIITPTPDTHHSCLVNLSRPFPQHFHSPFNHVPKMNASPELGEQTLRRLPIQLPPVLHYRPGKEAVPQNAEVLRPHPPLYAGDFNKRKDAYYWEVSDRNNHEDKRLRLALHYGEERTPRCDLCEKEDRACVSSLGKRYKTTGCARCIRRHFPCSQANGNQKSTSNVRKITDDTVRRGHPYRQHRY
jgi:hypothetical protein